LPKLSPPDAGGKNSISVMVTFPDSVLLVSVNVSVSSVLDVSTWMLSRTDSVMHLLKRQDVPHPVTIRQSDIINISLFISKIVDVLNNSIRKDFRAFTHRFFRKKICAIITVVHEEMFDQDGRAYRLPLIRTSVSTLCLIDRMLVGKIFPVSTN